jgi:hypothetical protein
MLSDFGNTMQATSGKFPRRSSTISIGLPIRRTTASTPFITGLDLSAHEDFRRIFHLFIIRSCAGIGLHRKIIFRQPPARARRAAAAPAMIGRDNAHLVGIVADLQQSCCSFCVRVVLRPRVSAVAVSHNYPRSLRPNESGDFARRSL